MTDKNRKLWLDTRGVPVITTTKNGETNAIRWGWTEAKAVAADALAARVPVQGEPECECWPTEEKYHFVHFGATEPGSAFEYNPECPEHGEPNDEPCLGCGSAAEDGHDDCTIKVRTFRATVPDAATAAVERVRAIHQKKEADAVTGDCATESCEHEDKCPTQVFEVCIACWNLCEESDPYFGERGIGVVLWPCPTVAALDGAPEPEWEYGFELVEPDDRNVFEREGDFISAAFAYRAAKKRIDEEHQADLPRLQYLIVRRRKAGPWLPVEGESKS